MLIDGLRYNLTTLNGDVFVTGREFYSSGEAAGNGAGSNVQFNSLQGIPSEEIGGIDVYKVAEGVDYRRWSGRHDRPENARSAGPDDGLQPGRQLPRIHHRQDQQLDTERHPGRRLQVQRPSRRHRQLLLRGPAYPHRRSAGLQPIRLERYQFGADPHRRPAYRIAIHHHPANTTCSRSCSISRTSTTAERTSAHRSVWPGR